LRHGGEEQEQRRVLGRINADAALHAGLRSAQNAKPAVILLIGSQRTVRATEAVGGARGGCAGRAGRADAHSTDGRLVGTGNATVARIAAEMREG